MSSHDLRFEGGRYNKISTRDCRECNASEVKGKKIFWYAALILFTNKVTPVILQGKH